MKILAVSHTGLVSGAERVLVGQLDDLRKAGHDIVLACGPGPLRSSLDGLTICEIPELKPPSRSVTGAVRLAVAHMRAGLTLRRTSGTADLVLFNSPLALPATLGVRLGPPVGLVIHDVLIRRDRQAILRLFSRTVDRSYAVSEAAAGFARSIGMDVRVVPNGSRLPAVDPTLRPSELPPGPPIVGINAAITPWKGHTVLLDAIAHLPGVQLEILGQPFPGDRDHHDSLVRRAQRPDLAGRVSFLGHRDDVEDVMRRWTVSVSASVEPEAGPLVVVESMALGIPLVATDLGGTPEVLGDAGLLVPPGDSRALAAAIERIVSDPALAQRCRVAGTTAVRERYNVGRSLAAFAQEMAHLARARSSR